MSETGASVTGINSDLSTPVYTVYELVESSETTCGRGCSVRACGRGVVGNWDSPRGRESSQSFSTPVCGYTRAMGRVWALGGRWEHVEGPRAVLELCGRLVGVARALVAHGRAMCGF